MVAQERHALFNLIIALSALLIFATLIPILGPTKAQGAFGILGISGFGPLFLMRRRGKVIADERDQIINLRAMQASFAIFWVLFVAGMMATYYIFQNRSTISIAILPLVLWLGWATLLICHSSILLLLYRRS